jgi:hypothetical protein
MGWTIRGSNPGMERRFSLFQNIHSGAGALKFHEYRRSFRGSTGRGVKLTTQLHPVPRLRMSGAVPLLPLYALLAWSRTTYKERESETLKETKKKEIKKPYKRNKQIYKIQTLRPALKGINISVTLSVYSVFWTATDQL